MLNPFNLKVSFVFSGYRWLLLTLSFLLFFSPKLKAQTDTEFWFVAPEVTLSHYPPGGANAFLKLSAGSLPAEVTISMPAADPAVFPDIVVNIPAFGFQLVDLTCWVVSPCVGIDINTQYVESNYFDVNLLENKYLNATGVNNFGVHITSTTPITAYYEISRRNNKDIWALKGKNGLGTEFYTPFQTNRDNWTGGTTKAYSAIDVVATEDGTEVQFTLPIGIAASFGAPATTRAGGSTFTVTLDRGQTFSLFPRWRTDQTPNRPSQLATDRLRGVRIVSLTGGPIAVTVNDDSFYHTRGTCYDLAGDQLIPTDIIGKEYAVIRTDLYKPLNNDPNPSPISDRHDHIYVLATQNGTSVTVYRTDGSVEGTYPLNAMQQAYIRIPSPEIVYRIKSNNPVYVWHVGGFGCEQGGAILPPIDQCTGVPRVAFARTSTETFYIIMMVRKGAEDSFLFDGVVRNDLFPPGSFTELQPLPSDWSVARFGPFTTGQIAQGTHYMENTEDIFHLGIVNGSQTSGCFYGYFSDYDVFSPSTLVVETGTSGGRVCVGETLQLYADGGTSYLWDPVTYLDDPTSPTPIAFNIGASINYTVTVSGACGLSEDISVGIQAAGPVTANFEPDTYEGCAAPPAGGGTPFYRFTFYNTSTDDDFTREWRWRLGPTGPLTTFATGNDASADPVDTVTLDLPNNTDQILEYYITLVSGSDPPFCFSEHTEMVRVYPYLDVQPNANIYNGCQPLGVNFQANPIGNFVGATYTWDFGNGIASNQQDPSYTYLDPTPTGWVVNNFYAKANITDQWNVCRSTDSVLITVQPYIKSNFLVSDQLGCAPLNVSVQNTSLGGISSYNWQFISNPAGHTVSPVPPTADPFSRTLLNTTAAPIDYTFRHTVANSYGCQDITERIIRVNPQVNVSFAPNGNIVLCDSSEVSFNSSIVNAGLPNVNYSWTFGDGGVSFVADPVKLYRNLENTPFAETYPITLTAITEFGCTDTETANAVVHPRILASFSVDKPVICSGEEVDFSYLRMGSISNYTFEFLNYGDQTWPGDDFALGSFTKQFVNETGSPITVTVRLTVENENSSCTKVLEKVIIVNPSVSASFTPNFGGNTIGCNPLTVSFSNSTVFTGGAAFSGNYSWDFGDGASSIQSNPTHEFINTDPSNPAIYPVTLTATSVHGCVDVATYDIEVQPRLEAIFTMNPGSVCSPTDVTFTPSSVGATRFLWDFDDIIPDEERFNNDPFTYSFTSTDPNNTEVKTITLTVVNAAGCTDSYSLDITLYPLVISNFTASIDEGCSDLEVTFTNSSTGGGVMYNWDFDDEQTFSTTSSAPITHNFVNRGSSTRVFNVKLLTVNGSGCESEYTVPITVYPKVEADFTFDYDSVCTPFNVTFENGSLNGTEYQWDFDHLNQDTITYNKNSFIRVFDNPTENDILTYDIELIALDNATGCSDTITKPIEVYPRVVASFAADSYAGCNPLEVQFTNNSTGLGSYLWEFDDETSSDDDSPLKIFSHSDRQNSRDYTVRLTATNANGCKSVNEQIITVYPLVEADFSIVDADGCTPFTVTLDNSTVSPAYTYHWDFGDGQTSTAPQPDPVEFVNDLDPLSIFQPNIVLTTRYIGDQTCMATRAKQVSVYPHIYPNFSADLEGCHPHSITLTNQTNAFGGLASPTYEWDFKNGTFSNQVNPFETFTNTSFTDDSTYAVMLRATSIHGCVDSVSQQVTVHPNPRARIEQLEDNVNCSPFEVEFVNISEGVNLSYLYEFGDGADSLTVSANPMVHSFRNLSDEIQPYTTILTAETEFGCTHQFFQTLWVYPEVEASFSFDPTDEFCNPAEVQMVNQSVNTWYYVWDFGDGSTSYLQNPTNTFLNLTTDTRVFQVTLTAFSQYDCEQSVTLPLTVHSQPEADFSIDPPLRVYPEADFTFTNQTQPASEDWSYSWDFDDGGPGSNLMHPGTHTYEIWGPASNDFQYFVTLFVTNGNCSDQITHPLTLRPAEPDALFDADIYASCPPLEVQFINASSYGSSYLWDFGDGTTSTAANPKHTFNETGYYNVSLTVYGDGGSRTYFNVLQVYPTPIADFAVLPEVVVLPDGVASFYNLSEGASTYLWDFGDGRLSTEVNPVHKYEELGDYTVELVAYSNFNCTDTLTRGAAVIVEGAGMMRFPNAFVPNKSGPSGGSYGPVDFSNEIFHPVHEGVVEYKLLIFNRWGEQIFESNDVWVGWDGYFNGVLSAQDVYVWRAKGKFSNGKDFDMRGNVTLLR